MEVFMIKRLGYKLAGFFLLLTILMYSSYKVEASAAKERLSQAHYSYIFMFKDNVSKNQVLTKVTEISEKYPMVIQSTFKLVNKGFTSYMSAHAAALLAQEPEIKYYERNSRVKDITVIPITS